MIYPLIAIVALALALYAANRLVKENFVCPICAATVITWLGALIGAYFKIFSINALFIAILAGISLGAATEKYGRQLGLWWKMIAVLLGAPAIYFIASGELLKAGYLLLALLFFSVLFNLTFSAKTSKAVYKDKFNDCCN